MWVTAKATVNAIRTRGVRVVAKRKPSQSSQQLCLPLWPEGEWVWGRTPEGAQIAHKRLAVLQQQFEGGKQSALLEALDLWLDIFQGPPRWIADGFFYAYTRWLLREVPTLDAAFGVRLPVTYLPAQHRRETLRAKIIYEVARLSQQGKKPRNIDLFHRVSERVGMSTGYVLKVYCDKSSAVWKQMSGLDD